MKSFLLMMDQRIIQVVFVIYIKKDLIIRLKSFIKKMEACRKLEIQEFFMHREFILFFWIAMIIFWIKMP